MECCNYTKDLKALKLGETILVSFSKLSATAAHWVMTHHKATQQDNMQHVVQHVACRCKSVKLSDALHANIRPKPWTSVCVFIVHQIRRTVNKSKLQCQSEWRWQKEVAGVLLIDFSRERKFPGSFTALIKMTRTAPQISISQPNINSLIIAAVQDRF